MDKEKIKKQIIDMLSIGYSLKEISVDLFKTDTTAKINNLISKFNINPGLYNKQYLYMDKEWLKKQLKHKTILETCKEFNMPRTSVTRYAERFGLYDVHFHRNKANYVDKDYFKTIDTAEKGYWLGFIMADGCMSYQRIKDKYCMCIRLNRKDKKHVEKFAKTIGFDISKIKNSVSYRKETTCYYSQIRTYNKVFCKHLINKGIIPRKSGKEIFPDTDILPEEYQADFIRGFYDGDGSVLFYKKDISICSSSKIMIDTLTEWFLNHDIHYGKIGTIKLSYENGYLYSFRILSSSIEKFVDMIYYPGCIALDRKMKEANKMRSGLSA